MTLEQILSQTEGTVFTRRQLEAYIRRRIMSQSRGQVAEVMGTSKSNIDNLERRGRAQIERAERSLELIEEAEQSQLD